MGCEGAKVVSEGSGEGRGGGDRAYVRLQLPARIKPTRFSSHGMSTVPSNPVTTPTHYSKIQVSCLALATAEHVASPREKHPTHAHPRHERVGERMTLEPGEHRSVESVKALVRRSTAS